MTINKKKINILILFLCFSLLLSIVSTNSSVNFLNKTDFVKFTDSQNSNPVDSSNHNKKIKFFTVYNRFDLKNLIKIKFFVLNSLIVLLSISFLNIIDLIGLFKINFKKKKHFIAKYVQKIYNLPIPLYLNYY